MGIFHSSFSIFHLREKSSTDSHSEAGFTPEGAMRKTAALSYISFEEGGK